MPITNGDFVVAWPGCTLLVLYINAIKHRYLYQIDWIFGAVLWSRLCKTILHVESPWLISLCQYLLCYIFIHVPGLFHSPVSHIYKGYILLKAQVFVLFWLQYSILVGPPGLFANHPYSSDRLHGVCSIIAPLADEYLWSIWVTSVTAEQKTNNDKTWRVGVDWNGNFAIPTPFTSLAASFFQLYTRKNWNVLTYLSLAAPKIFILTTSVQIYWRVGEAWQLFTFYW